MDIGKSFSFSFEEKDWVSKFLIGALVSAVPILNFAFTGYLIDIIRNVIDRDPLPLPEWSDFGDKWVKGLVIWVVGIIYTLPAILLFVLPIIIMAISGAASGADFQEAILGVFAGVGVLLGCLLTLYLLAFSFFFPAVNVHYAREGAFGSCFQVGDIIAIATENFGNYIVAWLITLLAGLGIGIAAGLISALFSIIPCIGWILSWMIGACAAVWIGTVWAHLFGQVAVPQPAE